MTWSYKSHKQITLLLTIYFCNIYKYKIEIYKMSKLFKIINV